MTSAEEAFFKQRRNLIGVALLVSFVNVAGGEIKKINLLGNEILFTNPNAIPVTLGAALIYFVVRYVQYAHDVEDKGFKKRFLARVEWYLAPYLMKREFNKPNSDLRKRYPNWKDIRIYEFTMFHDAMPQNTAAASFTGKDGGSVVDENKLKVSNWELVVPFARAAAYIVFRTRLATDYVLPGFLAIAAFSTYASPIRTLIATWL